MVYKLRKKLIKEVVHKFSLPELQIYYYILFFFLNGALVFDHRKIWKKTIKDYDHEKTKIMVSISKLNAHVPVAKFTKTDQEKSRGNKDHISDHSKIHKKQSGTS